MKLVLANNQTERFVAFYDELRGQNVGLFDYAPYDSLLFLFDTDSAQPIDVKCLATGKNLSDYDGVYLNGYLDTYELAATTASCCQALDVPFVNQELANAPSLSKLTTYAKLAANDIRIPNTIAGAQAALLQASEDIAKLKFPLVLKRADADRGIDNYKVASAEEISELLEPHDSRSIWILQEYVENDGFYLVSFYDQKPEFAIFRSLEVRPDGDARKAHMFKPKGGSNAQLLDVADTPPQVVAACQRSIDTLNRQIGSVDCLYNPVTEESHVLEVNYNPQLVTIETFRETRIKAFLAGISKVD